MALRGLGLYSRTYNGLPQDIKAYLGVMEISSAQPDGELLVIIAEEDPETLKK